MNTKETFLRILEDESYGIMPAPTEAQLAVDVLAEYLLGDRYYIAEPLSNEQGNTVMVHDILMKHSRKYRREIKRRVRRAVKACEA